jgi:hypothetical protein
MIGTADRAIWAPCMGLATVSVLAIFLTRLKRSARPWKSSRTDVSVMTSTPIPIAEARTTNAPQ